MTFEDAITGMIEHLRIKREQIEEAIARLTALPAKSKRGRKSMPAEERKIVSQRMRNYWAARRAEREVCIVVPAGVTITRSFEDALLRAAMSQVPQHGRLYYLHGARSNA